jgi:hypothetical protein
MPSTLSLDSISDINILSRFLAHAQVEDISTVNSVDALVICASAVLHPAEVLFHALEKRPGLTKALVLCGGIGHSTPLIYKAVAQNPKYSSLAKEVEGLPEARVLREILHRNFDVSVITSNGCKIIIEDQSTNSYANAVESRKVLESAGLTSPRTLLIIQDPTMQIRTVASFEKVYSDLANPPQILSCPIIIPEMIMGHSGPGFNISGLEDAELWEQERFFGLILGEIPRLSLYGPQGKGSIVHVDVPSDVEAAWKRLQNVLESKR